MIIECLADYWTAICEKKKVQIEKTDEGVFINGRKAARVIYNLIQLRFEMLKDNQFVDLYIVFDGRSGSPMTIKEMHEKLK